MSPEETFQFLRRQVEEAYRDRITKAARTDAVLEDRLRTEMNEEIRRIRASFVRFRGQATGWDTSFLRDEFTHGNDESMMFWRDESTHSQRFYFFIRDRLWKLYQAFDASVFPGATFEQFAEAIQARFGRGIERSGVLVEGRAPVRWIEWQDASTRLRAVDQTRFYGFFCLVFEDKATVEQLPQLRTRTVRRATEDHALVASVVRDADAQPGGQEGDDPHADIADRLTGQLRPQSGSPTGSGDRAPASRSSSSSSSPGRRGVPDDPLAGMDL
jgi:hypothetical protein